MIKVDENVLISVRVTSVIETKDGVFYEVAPLDKESCYQSMRVTANDIQSYFYPKKGGQNHAG